MLYSGQLENRLSVYVIIRPIQSLYCIY